MTPLTSSTPPPPGSGRTSAGRLSRRTLLIGAAAGLGAVGVGVPVTRRFLHPPPDTLEDRPLHSLTVAFTSANARTLVTDADDVIPGTRVMVSADRADELVAREQDWLDSLTGWTRAGPYAGAIRDAYLDLFVLTEGLPATVAGWSPLWRHVWPRDTAHAAVAFAAAGDLTRAGALLDYLAALPRTEHAWFEARYSIEHPGPPDDRHPQFDGLGWSAWALGWIHENAPLTAAEREDFLSRRSGFAAALADTLLSELAAHDGRPPVSPDYWEVRETAVTLGTAAPSLAGLQWLTPILEATGDARANACAHAEARLSDYIAEEFAAHGFPRHAGGRHADAAVGFMLPPYVRHWPAVAEVREALQATEDRIIQPAGGVNPGEKWHRDGISWTPETAVFALADAHGTTEEQRAAATRRLDWLDTHRTPTGSYPEKILASGEPSAVAPLAWTAACAALTARTLSEDTEAAAQMRTPRP